MAVVKLIKKLDVTDLAGEKAMIDFESGNYFLLKGAANEIWDLIQQETTTDKIVAGLLAVYNVDEEECRRTTEQFLHTLEKYKFIELS
ncbi:MAG: PqqD family peptide modification chaperone [Oscillospiraceae bacterium]